MQSLYSHCELCPRNCKVDRFTAKGHCGEGILPRLGRAMLHYFEEPCISGTNGSGAIFFSGCSLKCCYCQNNEISLGAIGKTVSSNRLADIILELEQRGAHNINLVTATHFVPTIREVLEKLKPRLSIPVVFNCGGYENVETLKLLDGLVDIYIPDLKYKSAQLSQDYSGASDYFSNASKAIKFMQNSVGNPQFSGEILKKGLIIRHLILPKSHTDSIDVIDWIADTFSSEQVIVSLMSQYTPYKENEQYPHLNRRIYSYEYNKVLEHLQLRGLNGYMQQRSSAKEEFTPSFDLSGV